MTNLNELRQRAQAEIESRRTTWISIDTGKAGAAAGATAVAETIAAGIARLGIDARMTAAGPLGWREAEPVVAIAKPGSPRVYYANVTPALAAELAAGLAAGAEQRLDLAFAADTEMGGLPALKSLPFFASQRRTALRNVGAVDPEDLSDALAHGAYAGLERALELEPEAVIEAVERAGLRGRGTNALIAQSWRDCRFAATGQRTVVADAVCGYEKCGPYDLLLEGDPHAVLEGVLIAAYAAGAQRAIVGIDPGSNAALRRTSLALEALRAVGLVGDGIAGTDFSCEIEIREVPRRLAAAEETILLAALEGRKPAQARVRPPSPEQEGLNRKPATVADVEALALVPVILAEGSAEGFVQTRIIQLAGSLTRTGCAEIPVGIPLKQIVDEIAGGPQAGQGLKAVQIGGPSGGWIPAGGLDVAFESEELLKAGCKLIAGPLVAAAGNACAVELARQSAAAGHRGVCGKCTFGREGTRQLQDVLGDLTKGRGLASDIGLLEEIAGVMKDGAMCANGRNATDAVLTTLKHFRGEYEAHVNEKRCPAETCNMAGVAAGEKVAQ
jgi:NADH-quinone oxidoreductase subunit F